MVLPQGPLPPFPASPSIPPPPHSQCSWDTAFLSASLQKAHSYIKVFPHLFPLSQNLYTSGSCPHSEFSLNSPSQRRSSTSRSKAVFLVTVHYCIAVFILWYLHKIEGMKCKEHKVSFVPGLALLGPLRMLVTMTRPPELQKVPASQVAGQENCWRTENS